MLMHIKAASLAAGAIRVRYTGKYKYASLALAIGTPAAPVLQLGVSDTSLADAVTNDATVITGDATLNHRDVVASINNWLATTASHEVLEGDFKAELYNSLYSDIFGGTATPYPAAAGSLNLKNEWQNALIIDDDATGFGYTSLMIAPPSMSKGPIAIKEISGHPGTSGNPTVTRAIYDMDGNVLVTTAAAVASATDALLLKTFSEPVVFDGPVIVRDTCATEGHNDATTMIVMYAFPQAKNF